MRRACRRALLAAGLAAPAVARAQRWPNGTLRLVVPFPPGGSVDAIARLLSPQLSAALGVPVVVENRAGASGAIGTGAVARGPADGQSWVFVFDTHAVNPTLIREPGFDTQRDLTPVLLIGTAPMVVTTPRQRPWADFATLVAAAKARPETLTYGTIGNGSLAHLTMKLLERAAGVQLIHVPYRGGGPLTVAAAAAEVDLPVATATVFAGLLGAGTLRPLASTGAVRAALAPAAPTLRELGLPVEAEAFWGVLTRAGTPAPVVARFEAALREALAQPVVAERLSTTLGITVAPQGEKPFRAFLDRQIEVWGRVVRENEIQSD